MYKLFTLFICFFISSILYSQREYGLEYQHGFGKSYNSNSIGTSFERFNNRKSRWQIVAHYTWDIFVSDKKTQGVSDFGISVGYRYGFSYGDQGNFMTGIRATFSHLLEKKHTRFTPSAEFGYHYIFNEALKYSGFLTPSLAFGYDIPIGKEKKEDFNGTLFIPRISGGYRFSN